MTKKLLCVAILAIAAGLVGWSASRSPAEENAKAAPVKKWEYKTTHAGLERDEIKALNHEGEAGWELVSVVPPQNHLGGPPLGAMTNYYWKRSKP